MTDKLPGWTCPSIDRIARVLRRHVPDPDLTRSLAELEVVRMSVIRMRAIAGGSSPTELATVDRRIETLTRRLESVRDAEHADGLVPSTWPPEEPTPVPQEDPVHLSIHFTLAEMTVTSTGLANIPGPEELGNLRRLCCLVLDPWRLVIGRIRINSGYRSPAVNHAVGGAITSDHMRGRAADCKPLDVPIDTAWRSLVALLDQLPVDQAILYVRPSGHGWIHVSTRPEPRREVLVEPAYGARKVLWQGYQGPLVAP